MLLSTGRLGGILQRPVPAIHEYHQRRSGKRQPRPPDARRIRTRPTFPRVRVWRTVFRNAPSGPGQGVPAARERFRRQKFRGGVQRHHPTGEDAPPETGDDRQHRPRTPHTGNEHPGLPRNGARNADAARKGAGLHHQSLPADARSIGTHPRHEPAHEDRGHARFLQFRQNRPRRGDKPGDGRTRTGPAGKTHHRGEHPAGGPHGERKRKPRLLDIPQPDRQRDKPRGRRGTRHHRETRRTQRVCLHLLRRRRLRHRRPQQAQPALRTFLPSRRGTHEGRGRFRARTVDSEEHRQPPRRNHNSQRAP